MAGYIGSKSSVTQVDGYNRTEADAEFVNDPNSVITVSGSNVGIGTSSPNGLVELRKDSAAPYFVLNRDNNKHWGSSVSSSGNLAFQYGTSYSAMSSSTPALMLDSSGNLLVGKTSSSTFTAGNELRAGGLAAFTRSGSYSLNLNRLASDGDIAVFQKDGTTVGSIGTIFSNTYIAGTVYGLRFYSVGVLPCDTGGNAADNLMDLGTINTRFDDIYATNGTIQTSDRNEKQDIEVLSDAETRVAQACKGLLRKFRWQDAVAEKGDDARIHFGIIAQDLQDAFAAEGLDAGRYAMFISSTWWETQTDVPAVEAVAEVLDDDGNVVTEAVEAKEAYTRTDTYETQAEAPEGATERTRLGVRYPELLAFIIGAM